MNRVISDTALPIKIWASDLEPEAEQQVRNLASLPFIYRHVSVMADAHAGRGSTIGTVIATKGAICPSCVGVDIGCGVHALRLPFTVDALGGDAKLRELRHSIERAVPTGRHGNKEISDRVKQKFDALGNNSLSLSAQGEATRTIKNAALQLGSLGGGNHFLEICKDAGNNAWILLHSGSRNIGKCLAERHIEAAKNLMKQYFISLPDPDLAYLAQGTPEFKAYLDDLMWAQNYAMANRTEMMNRIMEQVYRHLYRNEGDWASRLNDDVLYKDLISVNTHHNYTAIEHHFGHNVYVTRKGAVSAKAEEWGIIPGSMSSPTYIVTGKGNPESFNSCSHGAGRRMSRTKARQMFTQADLVKRMEGIEARTSESLVDEIQDAYKDISVVMKDQEDLVDIQYELKQIVNIKGD